MRFVLAVPGWYLGGITTFCTNLSAGLRQAQHEVILLRGSTGPLPPPAAIRNLFDGYSFVPRGISGIESHLRKYVVEIERWQPDVLVVNDSPYVMAALPFLSRAITRLPVLHSLLPWEMDLGLSNPEWWDRVIAVSQSAAKAIAARGLERRARVCLLGVPLPPAAAVPIRSEERPLAIISVGRIVVQDKRMDRLPAIAEGLVRRNIDYQWTVLGDGDYLPTLRSELKRLGLLGRFDLRGSVPASTVSRALAKADVLVMPSDSEGTPQALLEAMAHGVVPVVSRLAGSTNCIVNDRTNGFLCEPSQPAAFINVIADLAHHPERRREVGHNAASAIAREFSLDSFASRFLAVVNEVRSQPLIRPEPRSPRQARSNEMQLGCLGFWRCVRTETLGRLKRWWLGRRVVKAAETGALLPSM